MLPVQGGSGYDNEGAEPPRTTWSFPARDDSDVGGLDQDEEELSWCRLTWEIKIPIHRR